MATRLVHLAIDTPDPAGLARFWSAALDWPVAEADPDEVVIWPAGYQYPDPVALPLVFLRVPEPKTAKNRIHLDLPSASADDQLAKVGRLRDLGAVPADVGQGEVPWVVLADPQGNEFCVLEPRPVYRDTGPVAAVVADSTDPVAAAGFWTQAAGWAVHSASPQFAALRSPGEVGPYLEFLRVPEAKTVKNRVHLDLRPQAADDQLAEVARLTEAGAVPADVGQRDVTWVVLADPEGGEFCVLTPL
ncbi:MAG TPA: VOC family protein [Streptosporangiaceae bacterium]|jgi:predicted enzyme related to lactoylglutathione lyase